MTHTRIKAYVRIHTTLQASGAQRELFRDGAEAEDEEGGEGD